MSELFNHWIRDLEDFKDMYKNDKEEEFDVKNFKEREDSSHIQQLMERCINGSTNERITEDDAKNYYYDCIKEEILYHYPEDSETLYHYINAYNFLSTWK